jgi:hypothetical protein
MSIDTACHPGVYLTAYSYFDNLGSPKIRSVRREAKLVIMLLLLPVVMFAQATGPRLPPGLDGRFLSLTQEVPGFGGYFFDANGDLNVYLFITAYAPQTPVEGMYLDKMGATTGWTTGPVVHTCKDYRLPTFAILCQDEVLPITTPRTALADLRLAFENPTCAPSSTACDHRCRSPAARLRIAGGVDSHAWTPGGRRGVFPGNGTGDVL